MLIDHHAENATDVYSLHGIAPLPKRNYRFWNEYAKWDDVSDPDGENRMWLRYAFQVTPEEIRAEEERTFKIEF